MPDTSRRLVVVSNRVGPLVSGGKAGGLAVAMADALKERGGLWFGWSGNLSASGTWGPINRDVHDQGASAITLATLDMTEEDFAQFYEGYANRVLWPLLHYRTDLIDYDPKDEDGYKRVNQRFATRLAGLVEPDDLIWVQDYHYLTFAQQLRMAEVPNRIGFFLHIPFPPPDVFNVLPGAPDMLRALLAYDVLGFQTQGDAENMIALMVAEGASASGRRPSTSWVASSRSKPSRLLSMRKASPTWPPRKRRRSRKRAPNIFSMGVSRLSALPDRLFQRAAGAIQGLQETTGGLSGKLWPGVISADCASVPWHARCLCPHP